MHVALLARLPLGRQSAWISSPACVHRHACRPCSTCVDGACARARARVNAQEIEERRSFLRDLESNGALKRETVHMLRAEIQQRVAELERIDLLMKKADGIGKE